MRNLVCVLSIWARSSIVNHPWQPHFCLKSYVSSQSQSFISPVFNCFANNITIMFVHRVALNAMYPWQSETNMHLPGGAISVAHQFLRCVLHQLAPNGVFLQMFQTHLNGTMILTDWFFYETHDSFKGSIYLSESTRMQFFKSVTQALVDFNELNPIAPLQLLLEVF